MAIYSLDERVADFKYIRSVIFSANKWFRNLEVRGGFNLVVEKDNKQANK